MESFSAYKKASALKDIRLILVNDGSGKNAAEEIFQSLKKSVPELEWLGYPTNRGKGYALRKGVEMVRTDLCLLTDIDFPYTLESMLALEKILLEKGGICVGYRPELYYKKVPFFRKILSQAFRWLIRKVLRLPVDDTQCGLKGFDRAGSSVFLKTTVNRFLFDLEFLILAKGKVPINPVHAVLREGIVFSSVRPSILIQESFNFLKILFRKS